MKQVYFSPWEILIATFLHLLLAKVPLPQQWIFEYIYTLGVSSDISHGRIKEAMDTNLLEVAGSSVFDNNTIGLTELSNKIKFHRVFYLHCAAPWYTSCHVVLPTQSVRSHVGGCQQLLH